MATPVDGEGQPSLNGTIPDPQTKKLTDLPTELLEHILCFPVLKHVDICNVSCCCKRLHDVCHGRGKVWGHQYKLRCCFFVVLYAGFWWLFVLSRERNLTLLLFMRSLELLISKCLLWGGFVYCELTGSCQPLTLCWCTKFIITPCRWLPSCNNNEAYNCLQLLQVAIYSPLHQMNSSTMNLYDLEC